MSSEFGPLQYCLPTSSKDGHPSVAQFFLDDEEGYRESSGHDALPSLSLSDDAIHIHVPKDGVATRLTEQQLDTLQLHFQKWNKPTASYKRRVAVAMDVPLDHINVRMAIVNTVGYWGA
jgi:hypothetical protein